MLYRPREEWVNPSQPVVGPAMRPEKVELLPAHYTSSSTIPLNIPAYLRSMQNDYTVNRGYSVGYNFAIDQTGEAWELRGFDFRCAANVNMNDVTIAILCMVDGQQPMNDRMVAKFKALAAEAQRVCDAELLVVGHRDIGKTNCPGNGIYGQVQAGLLEPDDVTIPPQPQPQPPEPEPIPVGDIDMIRVDYGIPGVDDWWARMLIGGVGLTWVQGHANDGLDKMVPAHIQVKDDQHMEDLMSTYKCVGDFPSTWGGNARLQQLWVESTEKKG